MDDTDCTSEERLKFYTLYDTGCRLVQVANSPDDPKLLDSVSEISNKILIEATSELIDPDVTRRF